MKKINVESIVYAVGCNIPGCLPDSEPVSIIGLSNAKECLVEGIARYLDELTLDFRFTEEQIKEFEKVLEDVERAKPTECHVWLGDYVFWITEEG